MGNLLQRSTCRRCATLAAGAQQPLPVETLLHFLSIEGGFEKSCDEIDLLGQNLSDPAQRYVIGRVLWNFVQPASLPAPRLRLPPFDRDTRLEDLAGDQVDVEQLRRRDQL